MVVEKKTTCRLGDLNLYTPNHKHLYYYPMSLPLVQLDLLKNLCSKQVYEGYIIIYITVSGCGQCPLVQA